MHVLVVEDDLRLAATLRRGLQEAGFSVDLVASGDEAIAAATGTPFDLIVLDVMLPGMDGFDVCTQLRRSRVRTPLLMLTGRDAVGDRIRGLEAGADDYLIKPFAFGDSGAVLGDNVAAGRPALMPRSCSSRGAASGSMTA